MERTYCVLIVEDDPNIATILRVNLASVGYDVLVAGSGKDGLAAFGHQQPDLVILDVVLPDMDGLQICQRLRGMTKVGHVPIIMLSARARVGDKVMGLNAGADDYMTKPFDARELLARIQAHIRRSKAERALNPLTGLPGNTAIEERLVACVSQPKQPWAFLHVDLDDFKVFNDTYGVTAGDRVIQMTARLLVKVVEENGTADDVVCHIGGDDFAVFTVPAFVDPICRAMIRGFDEQILCFYDAGSVTRGYISSKNRQGTKQHYPIMGVSIGVVTNAHRRFGSPLEVTAAASEMKEYAKSLAGSNYQIDRRSSP